METLCCSDKCEKRFECARADINNAGMHYVENYYSFGTGTMTENGCEIEHWCGELGNYKMFESIEKNLEGRGLRSKLLIIDELCDIEPETIRSSITNAWDDYMNTNHLKLI